MSGRWGYSGSGFLVVRRFEVVYRWFASRPDLNLDIYALPLTGTEPDRVHIRYQGLDREPLSAWDWGGASLRTDHYPDAGDRYPVLAEIRSYELRREHDYSNGAASCVLIPENDALEVLRWAELEAPGDFEVVWAQVVGEVEESPPGYRLLGVEPSYFPGGCFSAIGDCMCFPRWHGTDVEGTLFRDYFERLNANGLFDDPETARQFLDYYLSFDWTERGDFEIVEVWGRE